MNTISPKKLYIVGAASLALGIIFDYLFFDQLIGISFLIYVTLLCSGLFSFLFFFKIPFNKTIIWFLPIILFFALMVGVRENEFLLFWNIVLTLGLILLLARNTIGFKIKNYLFFDYVKTVIHLPFSMLEKSFTALGRMISLSKNLREGQKTAQIIKGVLITLPIVLLFFFLFSSADLVFNKLVIDIFKLNFSISPDTVAQILLAVIFAILWLGSYVYILENASPHNNSSISPIIQRYKLGNIEAGILFTTLSALFLTFVIVQIRYLFAGHEAIAELGYTYAEYAHKGFGELIGVALLTFGLIFLAERYIERSQNKPNLLFKILTGILIMLVLVIMASAFLRLAIYEQAYSFTLPRLLVQTFIIWLAAIFLWLSYKIIRSVADRPFIFGIFLSVIAFFVLFNLLNPDAFVARKNINQFATSGELDTKYLSSLSADAVPVLIPLLEMPGVKDKEGHPLSIEIAKTLKSYYESMSNQPWQSYHVSRHRALQLINSKLTPISTLVNQDYLR
jgi:hypothetical protein